MVVAVEIKSEAETEIEDDSNTIKSNEILDPLSDHEVKNVELLNFSVIIDTTKVENGTCDKDNLSVVQVKVNAIKPERTGWKHYIGIILGFGSCMSFSLSLLIVKYLGKKIGPGSFSVYRFIGVMMSLFVLLFYRIILKVNVFETIYPLSVNRPEKIKTVLMLLVRGISGCTSILLQYYSVRYISLASASTITFCTPIFVGLAAWIFLGEKCGIVPTFAALITLSGVIITACVKSEPVGEPITYKDQLIGGALAFLSMLGATTVFCVLRYLRRVHFSVTTSAFGVIGVTQSIIFCAIIGRFDIPDSSWEWFLVVTVAFLTLLSQTLMTLALKFEDAGPIALVRTTDVVFAFIWQYVFLGVEPDLYTSLGAFIVCVGVGLGAFRKYIASLLPQSKTRKRFEFMLK